MNSVYIVDWEFLKIQKCVKHFSRKICLNLPISPHLFFVNFSHRILAVSQWSWKEALAGLDSAFEEGRNTTWACSSFGWLRRGQPSKMGECM